MRKIFLSCLLAMVSFTSLLAADVSWVGTTYLPIRGSWMWVPQGVDFRSCYTIKVENTLCSFYGGAEIEKALRKASKVHVLQISTTEKRSVKVFKRRSGDSYVVQLGNEFFFFKEGECIRCASTLLEGAKEFQYASKKHGFLLSIGNKLVIYD